MTSTDVLIIGGGWAGLWSARALAGSGLSVRLIERRDVLGGRATSDGPDGFKMNLGPHALYRRGAARAALAEVGIVPTGGVPVATGARAWVGDELLTLPSGFVSFMTTSLLEGGARWGLLSALNRAMRSDPEAAVGRTLASWLDEFVTQSRARAVLKTLLRVTTYADDDAHMDAGAALRQLRLGLRGNVLYLDGGWGSVVDALERAALGVGAELRRGVTAHGIAAREGGVEVDTSEGPLRARAVIAAVTPDVAEKLLPALDLTAVTPVRAAVLDVALSSLPEPSQTLALGVDRPLYFSVHSAAACLAPDGAAMVHVARYGGAGPEGEAELEALFDRMQPGWRERVVARRYLPRITVAHGLPRADRPRPSDSGVDGVYLAGDWVGPTGMLADAALASARVAVEAIRARLGASDVAQRA